MNYFKYNRRNYMFLKSVNMFKFGELKNSKG